MPSKLIIIIKSIIRKWFVFVIILILIVAYVEWINFQSLIVAIVLTVIFIVLFGLHYLWILYKSKSIEKTLSKFYRIDDKTVAKKLKQSLSVIQEDMFELSQKQDNKNLEDLKEYNLETRTEIKTIEDTLIKCNRLSRRKISVKERREKERFEAL